MNYYSVTWRNHLVPIPTTERGFNRRGMINECCDTTELLATDRLYVVLPNIKAPMDIINSEVLIQ